MTADLQENVIFGLFIMRSMMISCHLKVFWKFKIILKFSMTEDQQRNVVFGLFTLLQILQPNEKIITF